MVLNFKFTFNIDIEDCKLTTIIANFNEIRKIFLNSFIQQILVEFATFHMKQKVKPFECEKCGNNEKFIWKTKHGKQTTIITIKEGVTETKIETARTMLSLKFSVNDIVAVTGISAEEIELLKEDQK